MTWAGFFKKNNSDYRRFKLEVLTQGLRDYIKEERDHFYNFLDKEEFLIACKNYCEAPIEMKPDARREVTRHGRVLNSYVNSYIYDQIDYERNAKLFPQLIESMDIIRKQLTDIDFAMYEENPSLEDIAFNYLYLRREIRKMDIFDYTYSMGKFLDDNEEKNCCASLCCIS